MSGNGYSFTPMCRPGVGQGTLYEQFHKDVQGDSPIHDNAAVFNNLATTYGDRQKELAKALATIKTTYTGSAADSMSSAFDPLIKSMADGQTMSQQAATALTGQAGQFTTAQSKINNTVPVPGEPWYEHMVPWNTAHDDAVDKNNDINNANNAAYQAYAKASGANVQTFPPFSDNDSVNTSGIAVTGGPVGPVGPGPGGVNGPGGGGGGYSPSQVGGPGGGGPGGGSYQPGHVGSSGGGQYQPGPIGADMNGNGQYQPGSGTNIQGAGGYPGGGGGGYPYPGMGGGSGNDGSGPGGFGGFPAPGGFGGGGDYASGGGGGYGRGGAGIGGGAGGMGGGARGAMGAGAGAAAAGAKPGAGAAAGLGAAAEEGRMGGPGAMSGARGAAGANGMMGGQGRGGKKEDDYEHKSAAYLVSEEDEIVGDLPATLPPGGVIGG